jgi:hypothetical protein
MTHNGGKIMTTTTPQSTKAADAWPARDLLGAARYYLGGWRGVVVLAIIAALVGIGLSWNWLVAAGAAPILLATLPCLVMCGLGFCMNRLFGGSCASPAQRSAPEPKRSEAVADILSTKPLDQRRDRHA